MRLLTTLTLEGYITEDGELRVQLPPDIAPGRVQVTLAPSEQSTEALPLELFTFHAVPADQLQIGGWEDLDFGTEDSAEWVARMRREEEQGRL